MAGSVDGDHGFQIAPMLDILFVLLLFFMVSAGAQKHETNLTTQLPGGAPGGDVPVQVTIDSDGQVAVNSVPTDTPENHDLPDTIAHLKGIVTANAKQPVVIIPTRSTKHQRVIDVLNACAAAEVKNLAFGSPGD
jgi:biopolymer transport protein ExbD